MKEREKGWKREIKERMEGGGGEGERNGGENRILSDRSRKI